MESNMSNINYRQLKTNNSFPNLKTDEIVKLFMDVAAKHLNDCHDFEINHWLTQYENNINRVHLTEAGLLILSAAQIYGRKVDYLRAMVIQFEKMKSSTENDRKISRERTKKQIHTGPKPSYKEHIPKSFNTTDICNISENLELGSDNIEMGEMLTNQFSMATTNNTKQLLYERINLIQNNVNCNLRFGNRRVFDKDFNDVDFRRNYKVYMNYIDQSENVIYNNIYVKKKLSNLHQQQSSLINYQQNSTFKPFHLYLPAAHLKKAYDIEIDSNDDYLNMLRYQKEMNNVLRLNVVELYDFKKGKLLNDILNGITMDRTRGNLIDEFDFISKNIITPLQDNEVDSTVTINQDNILNTEKVNDENPTIEDSCNAPIPNSDNLVNEKAVPPTDVRNSIDEGICSSNFSTPNCLSELDPMERAMFTPVVEMIDIFNISSNVTMSKSCLTFDLGFNEDITMNILQLPLSKLRKQMNFVLPKKFKPTPKRKLEPDSSIKRAVRKLNLDSSPITANDDEDLEGFLGFDNSSLDNVSFSLFSSTLLSKSVEIKEKQSTINSHTSENIEDQSHSMCITSERDSLTNLSNISHIESATKEVLSENLQNISLNCLNTEENIASQTNAVSSEVPPTQQQNSIYNDSGFGEADSSIYCSNTENEIFLNSANASQLTAVSSVPLIQQQNSTYNDSGLGERDSCYQSTIANTPIINNNDNSELFNTSINIQPNQNKPINNMKRLELLEMTNRVNIWHESLKPVLILSEKRNNFNIRELQNDIINICSTNSTNTFEDLISNRDRTHTARYFLALLQLANTRHIKISHSNSNKVCTNENLKFIKLQTSNDFYSDE